jgi:hypothetical protein
VLAKETLVSRGEGGISLDLSTPRLSGCPGDIV